ncbi:MAG TPA: signal peptide peptidase SppA [Syntrophales bacterium]|nr:MAG: putative signal peptide peptidase SppA [Deltaproteobacteria bacterium ADurb.Bin135]HPX80671.1 signal peptide peptidase SppA [Syntrophales bacterium]
MVKRMFISLICIAACLAGCSINIPLIPGPEPLREQIIEGRGSNKILIMDITGFISERDKDRSLFSNASPSIVARVREALQKAESDKDIAGIIIRINSPGGTITASDIIHHEILRFKARKRIPVYSCIMSIGTSGGYYISTATDNITAHPTSIIGSFAVMIMTMNIEGLMNKIGVRELTIKSGDKKDILSPFRTATPDEKQIVQAIINQFHEKFADAIEARPGNTLSRKDINALSDGRIYSSRQALESKIIDRIGYLDEVIDDLKKKIGVADARIVTYYLPGSYKGTIYSSSPSPSALNTGIVGEGSGLDWLGETQFLYLWRP